MRTVVLAALAAGAGFALYVFWAGGREAALPPAAVPVTETAPADAAGAVSAPNETATNATAGVVATAADTATGAVGAAVEKVGDAVEAAENAAEGVAALQIEIQGLVNEVVEEPQPPAIEPAANDFAPGPAAPTN